MNHSNEQVRVWDPLVRSFHWILVATFFLAYVTEDDFLLLHVWSGYIMGIAIMIRLVWGMVGTRHARFTDFLASPGTAINYVKDTLMLRAKRYVGHNPAGGLMIMVMLFSLSVTVVTGIALYGVAEQTGPLASSLAGLGEFWEDVLEGFHEFFANTTLLLVVVHVAGVVVESLVHKENLVLSMINGFKRAEQD